MKRFFAVLIAFVLCGCAANPSAVDRAVSLRNKIQAGNGCKFDATVTADYSDRLYSFRMQCETDNLGNLAFTVLEPESISGISGFISKDSGKLTFDEKVLAFETISEGRISPVSAPWLLMKILSSGYIKSGSVSDDGIYVQIDDSYAEETILMELWTDKVDLPMHCDLIFQGICILSIDVENFTFL